MSQTRLLAHVWGQDYADSLNVVGILVGYLRPKIELIPGQPEPIETIRGFGYR